MNNKLKILLLFLKWDNCKCKDVLRLLEKTILSIRGINWTIIAIDNKHEYLSWDDNGKKNSICQYSVGGDNSAHEFSGWEKGLKEAEKHLSNNYDLVAFCNDALMNSKPYDILQELTYEHFQSIKDNQLVLGWHDSFNDILKRYKLPTGSMRFGKRNLSSWICTTFFVLPKKVLAKCLPLQELKDTATVYSSCKDKLFKEETPLNSDYQTFLINHQTKIWYNRYQLTPENFPLFKQKTLMCINEHLLGERIFRHSAPLDLYKLNMHENARNVVRILGNLRNTFNRPLKLAVYGAGKHTFWLEQQGCIPTAEIHSLHDDSSSSTIIWGKKAEPIEQLNPENVDAVILSTDTFQQQMAQKVREHFGSKLKTIDFYK